MRSFFCGSIIKAGAKDLMSIEGDFIIVSRRGKLEMVKTDYLRVIEKTQNSISLTGIIRTSFWTA